MNKILVILCLCVFWACSEKTYDTINDTDLLTHPWKSELAKYLIGNISNESMAKLSDYENETHKVLLDDMYRGVNSSFGQYYVIPLGNDQIEGCLLCITDETWNVINKCILVDKSFIANLTLEDRYPYSLLFLILKEQGKDVDLFFYSDAEKWEGKIMMDKMYDFSQKSRAIEQHYYFFNVSFSLWCTQPPHAPCLVEASPIKKRNWFIAAIRYIENRISLVGPIEVSVKEVHDNDYGLVVIRSGEAISDLNLKKLADMYMEGLEYEVKIAADNQEGIAYSVIITEDPLYPF